MTKNTDKRKAEKYKNVNTLPDTAEEKRHRKSIKEITCRKTFADNFCAWLYTFQHNIFSFDVCVQND